MARLWMAWLMVHGLMLAITLLVLAVPRSQAGGPSLMALLRRQDNALGVYILLPDGADDWPVTGHTANHWDMTFSADGRSVQFNTLYNARQVRMAVAVNGRHLRVLSGNPDDAIGTGHSPDGTRVVRTTIVNGNSELLAMQTRGMTDVVRLTDHPADDWGPAWAPDGQWIAFVSHRDYPPRSGFADIYRIRPDGHSLQRLTMARASKHMPAWSPDSQWLAFANGEDIFKMRADGTDLTRLTNTLYPETSVVWSPPIRRPLHTRRLLMWGVFSAICIAMLRRFFVE